MVSFADTFEQQQLKDFAEKAYLDYSMYVILDRALPHISGWFKTGSKTHYLCDVRTWLKCYGEI